MAGSARPGRRRTDREDVPEDSYPAAHSEAQGGVSAEVVGVFVGEPNVIGQIRGRPVHSSIAKAPVTSNELELGLTNLDGDQQADLTVHGGPDKAVYFYPSQHYPLWQADGFPVDLGDLGENVAIAGVTEHDVRIGDTWRWGEALVQISQPRAPCYKLSLHTGRRDVGPRLISTVRCGWYVRVVEPGAVPTVGPMALNRRNEHAPTVYEAFAAMMFNDAGAGDDRKDVVARLLALPALADQWRQELAARYKR